MKIKLIAALSLVIALQSCGDGNTTDNKEFETSTTLQSEETTVEETNVVKNLNAFEENLVAFKDCRAGSSNKADCKEFIAKAVCEYYGIADLKEGNNYIDYDKIPEKLKELDSWEKVGAFNEDNIQIALEQLNSFEKPVLVFNNNDSYVHVVALTPNGNVIKSRKWGNISVPACASFFPTKSRASKSFIKNGINYAFGSADGLEIWMKN